MLIVNPSTRTHVYRVVNDFSLKLDDMTFNQSRSRVEFVSFGSRDDFSSCRIIVILMHIKSINESIRKIKED